MIPFNILLSHGGVLRGNQYRRRCATCQDRSAHESRCAQGHPLTPFLLSSSDGDKPTPSDAQATGIGQSGPGDPIGPIAVQSGAAARVTMPASAAGLVGVGALLQDGSISPLLSDSRSDGDAGGGGIGGG